MNSRFIALALVATVLVACAPARPNIGWQFTTPLPSGDIGLSPTAPPIGQPTDASQIRFSPWFVTDPMAEDVTAMTFLAPVGWEASGSVVWLPEWRRLAFLQTRINDPQTGLTIEWLPAQDFIWFDPPAGLPPPPIGGNYQGKAYVPPATDPAQFVADFWMPNMLAHLRGAQLTRVDQVPIVADEFVRQFGGPASAQAFRLRYEFDQAGQRWEEDVFFAWLFAANQPPVLWYVNFAYSVRAPKGVIDANQGLVSTVVASRTTTPQWEAVYRLVGQLFTQGIQQQMADTAAFGRQLQQFRAETQALQDQVVQERQAAQDRIADVRRDSLGGVQNLVNPFDQTVVQMPADWNHYWVSQQGEYIVSDQVNFDPNQDPQQAGAWQRLTPQP
jgi:hypothetical protein